MAGHAMAYLACKTVMASIVLTVDEDATAEITVGTYKYFKDIEKDNLNPASLL